MDNLSKKIIKKLTEKQETISFMESCTGGLLASIITNEESSSNVLKVSLTTYSDEYKIKFGISEKTIQNFTVYSEEVANEMAEKVTSFASSNYGIGVTGQIGENGNNTVFFSIYNTKLKQTYSSKIIAKGETRLEKKEYISKIILKKLLEQITNI